MKAMFHWRRGLREEYEVLDVPPPMRTFVIPPGELSILNADQIAARAVLFLLRKTGPKTFVYVEAEPSGPTDTRRATLDIRR